jgi:hypothetical protein
MQRFGGNVTRRNEVSDSLSRVALLRDVGVERMMISSKCLAGKASTNTHAHERRKPMSIRIVLIVVLLLGLAVGMCAGVEQAGLGRAIYLASEAADKADDNIAPQIKEAREYLDVCFNLTTAAMYLGVAVGLTACIGLCFHDKGAAAPSAQSH